MKRRNFLKTAAAAAMAAPIFVAKAEVPPPETLYEPRFNEFPPPATDIDRALLFWSRSKQLYELMIPDNKGEYFTVQMRPDDPRIAYAMGYTVIQYENRTFHFAVDRRGRLGMLPKDGVLASWTDIRHV